MISAATQTWREIEIPQCLEIVGRKSKNHLVLRLADEQQRRTWELYFDCHITPKTMHGWLYLEPWWFLDEREPDLTSLSDLTIGLIHKRATVMTSEHSVSFNGFHHAEGLKIVQAMLAAVEKHLETYPL